RRDRKQVVARARAAIEALDTAAIGTIHSFAASLLRRHPAAAGVTPRCDEEEGSHVRELSDELWPRQLEEALGKDEPPAAWRGLLEKLSPGEVKTLARRLAGGKVPLEPGGRA